MGIDLPRDIGTSRLSWGRLRRLVEFAPDDSALARARDDYKPSLEVQFLRRIEYWNHLLFWAKTKEGEKGRNAPSMVPLRGDDAGSRKRDTMELDELLIRRQRQRREELGEGKEA